MKRLWLGLRAVLAALLLPGTVGILGPRWIGGGTLWGPRNPYVDAVGLLLILGGAMLLVVCIAYFAIIGRGTLAPVDPPTVFVARGPYRWTRNPMYVAVACWLFGLAITYQSRDLALYAVIVCVAFQLFVTRVEEPSLARRFGDSYDEYRRRVPRWIGPRRRPTG